MLFCVLLSKFFYQVWALIDKHFSWHVLLSNFFYQVCAYVDKHFFHQKQCKLSAPKSVCRYFEQIVEKITSVMYFEKCLSTKSYRKLSKQSDWSMLSANEYMNHGCVRPELDRSKISKQAYSHCSSRCKGRISTPSGRPSRRRCSQARRWRHHQARSWYIVGGGVDVDKQAS